MSIRFGLLVVGQGCGRAYLERDDGVVVGVLDNGLEVVEEHDVGAVVCEDVGPGVEHAQHAQLHALRAQGLHQPVWVWGWVQGSVSARMYV